MGDEDRVAGAAREQARQQPGGAGVPVEALQHEVFPNLAPTASLGPRAFGLDGLEAARKRVEVGGRRPVVDDDKRAAILARRQRGESIRTIAAGVNLSVGVVHKTLTDPEAPQAAPGRGLDVVAKEKSRQGA
ncbi:hypothetical protein ACWDOR_36370 [Streptosporangium canum]